MVAYVDCFASHDGTVFKTLNSRNSSPTAGFGVYIRHNEGWWTLYFHMSEVLVKVGDIVKAGDKIGITGNTGQYTVGPHLHFGLYPANPDYNNGWGGAIDPMLYFSLEEILGTANSINNTMLTLKRQKGRQEVYAIINGKPYYIGAEAFADLVADKIARWEDIVEVTETINLQGVIK